jgi:hypothetical protein
MSPRAKVLLMAGGPSAVALALMGAGAWLEAGYVPVAVGGIFMLIGLLAVLVRVRKAQDDSTEEPAEPQDFRESEWWRRYQHRERHLYAGYVVALAAAAILFGGLTLGTGLIASGCAIFVADIYLLAPWKQKLALRWEAELTTPRATS